MPVAHEFWSDPETKQCKSVLVPFGSGGNSDQTCLNRVHVHHFVEHPEVNFGRRGLGTIARPTNIEPVKHLSGEGAGSETALSEDFGNAKQHRRS